MNFLAFQISATKLSLSASHFFPMNRKILISVSKMLKKIETNNAKYSAFLGNIYLLPNFGPIWYWRREKTFLIMQCYELTLSEAVPVLINFWTAFQKCRMHDGYYLAINSYLLICMIFNYIQVFRHFYLWIKVQNYLMPKTKTTKSI